MIAEQAAAKEKQDVAKNDGFVEVGKGGKANTKPSVVDHNLAIPNVSLNTKENDDHFYEDKKGTTSVAGGGPGVALAADTVDGQGAELLETMMRGIAINAVHGMKALNLEDPPATTEVLLAKREAKAGSGDAREGWQVTSTAA